MDFQKLLNSTEYDFIRSNERLGNRIMLLGLGGSYAYGTNNEGSDIDFRGVTLMMPSDLLGLTEFEQYEDDKTDTVIYGFNKLVRLLLECNPNTIEIPVIFVETDDDSLIRNIFDRLNRNGEPLEAQELRHAKYGETKLYKIIEELVDQNDWKFMLNEILEIGRMEDKEYISELLFLILENNILTYTKDTLDNLYSKWAEQIENSICNVFYRVMQFIVKMNLDYRGYKINKVSPLYTVWSLAVLGERQKINAEELGLSLNKFYDAYLSKDESLIGYDEYKKGMSSNTKGTASRNRRLNALIEYCNSEGITIVNDFGGKE